MSQDQYVIAALTADVFFFYVVHPMFMTAASPNTVLHTLSAALSKVIGHVNYEICSNSKHSSYLVILRTLDRARTKQLLYETFESLQFFMMYQSLDYNFRFSN